MNTEIETIHRYGFYTGVLFTILAIIAYLNMPRKKVAIQPVNSTNEKKHLEVLNRQATPHQQAS